MSAMNLEKNTSGEPRQPEPLSRRLGTPLLLLCITGVAVACLLLSAPASAGTKYMAGSPDLSAYISGTNEFAPGDTVSLPIVVQNAGINEYKFIQSGIVDTEDLPNTAKFLTVTLRAGNAPVIIKSDPQMVGDLKASTTVRCPYTVKILSGAAAGTYRLPLTLNYSYLYSAEQYGTDTIQYHYKTRETSLTIPITIRPRVKLDVVSTATEQVNAGTEGYVILTVKNTGHEDGKKSILKISRNGNSPVVPTQSSIYVGDFAMDQAVTGKFRISVSPDAQEQVYPLDVSVSYEDSEGDTITSDTETVGIPVGKKVAFTIVSDPVTVVAGKKTVITVMYRNTGGATVYNAQARISAVDPFSCSDDTAYLGEMAPGDTREAKFELSSESSATAKEYGLDSEVLFRDALDNSGISDPLKVRIQVASSPGILAGIAANPVVLALIVLIIAGGIAAYFLWYRKRLR